MNGRRHENGQSWHDGCRECYCHNGREMCALISCPVPNCDNPSIRASQCCPSCPGLTLHSLSFYYLVMTVCICYFTAVSVSYKLACMMLTFFCWWPLNGLIVWNANKTWKIDLQPTEWHSRVSSTISLNINECECFNSQLWIIYSGITCFLKQNIQAFISWHTSNIKTNAS